VHDSVLPRTYARVQSFALKQPRTYANCAMKGRKVTKGQSFKRDVDGWLAEYAGRYVMRVQHLRSDRAKTNDPKYTIGLKGTFGAGKSTVAMMLIGQDSEHYFVTAAQSDKKPIATFLPKFNLVIVGTYLNQCGGCDGLAPRAVQQYLRLLWPYDCHILYEGAIVAGIISTYYELTKALRNEHHRDVSFCFLNTPVEECVRRIYLRNGGKKFNEANVAAKDSSIWTAYELYVRKSDVQCSVLNTSCTKEEVRQGFLSLYPRLGATQIQEKTA
jgi:hypothetical protein